VFNPQKQPFVHTAPDLNPPFQAAGVTLTLSLAYLVVREHQQNRALQGDMLRAQARILNTLALDPSVPSYLAPSPSLSRTELAAQQRANLLQSAKDRWNSEMEGAVRWALTKDWREVRENAEDSVRSLLGVPPVPKTVTYVQAVDEQAIRRVQSARPEVKRDTTSVSKEITAKSTEKGQEIIGKAKSAVKPAKKLSGTKPTAASTPSSSMSEVEKALKQRYEKSEALSQSVQEALDARYITIAERDRMRLQAQ
jgi:altered-inheritance-of-mitochondria protein 5